MLPTASPPPPSSPCSLTLPLSDSPSPCPRSLSLSLQNRAELAVATIDAAKAAGVGHLTVQSVSTAGIISTVFGRQFHTIERATIASGLSYTIVRLPFFTDNIL